MKNKGKPGNTPAKNSFFLQWMFFLSMSILYIWLVRLIHNPAYLISDNLAILTAARNGFLAPFVHFLWSRLLTGLYALSQQTPWYGLCLYALHAASLSLVLTVFYRVISNIGFFFVFALVTLFFWSGMIVLLDFNGASIMIGSSATLFFFLLFKKGLLNLKTTLFTGIILAVSGLPRYNGILVVAALSAPFLGAVFLMAARQYNDSRLKAFSRMAILYTLLILPGCLIYSANEIYRNNCLTPDEAAYYKFNKLRGQFHGFPIATENISNQDIYKATGWTVAHYLRLQHWMIFDEDIYNIDTFENFYDHAVQPEKMAMEFSEIISSLFLVLKNYSPFFLLMAAGFLLAQGRKVYSLQNFIIFCMTGIATIGIALSLELFMRFPYRIAYPMLFSAGLLVFFFSLAPQNQKPTASHGGKDSDEGYADTPTSLKSIPAWIAGGGWKNFTLSMAFPAAVLLAILLNFSMLNDKYKSVHSYLQFNKNLTQVINTYFPGTFIIAEPLLSPFHFIDPISPPDTNFTRIPMGAATFSPLFYQTLGKMGLERGSELMPAMITRDDVLVVSRQPWMLLLLNYAHEQGLGVPQIEILAEIGIAKLYRLKQ